MGLADDHMYDDGQSGTRPRPSEDLNSGLDRNGRVVAYRRRWDHNGHKPARLRSTRDRPISSLKAHIDTYDPGTTFERVDRVKHKVSTTFGA